MALSHCTVFNDKGPLTDVVSDPKDHSDILAPAVVAGELDKRWTSSSFQSEGKIVENGDFVKARIRDRPTAYISVLGKTVDYTHNYYRAIES